MYNIKLDYVYHKRQKFGVTKVWRIRFSNILAEKTLANLQEVNKTSRGLVVSWRMKVWQILSIRQIRQTLATPNFHHLQYIPFISLSSFHTFSFTTFKNNTCLL